MNMAALLFPPLFLWCCAGVASGQSPAAAAFRADLTAAENRMLRSPDGFQKIVMDIDLRLDRLEYHVHEKITYTNNRPHPLADICFTTHMRTYSGDVTLYERTITGRTASFHDDPSGGFFRFMLAEALEPGETLEIILDYSVTIPAAAPKNSRLFAYSEGCLMLDYFYPAPMVYGPHGWDTSRPLAYGDLVYNEATLFEVTFVHDATFGYASTGRTTGTVPLPHGDRVADTIVTGPVRGFFLAGGADWVKYGAPCGETRVTVSGRRGQAARIKRALPLVVKAIKALSGLLVDYPYAEFDAVFIPAGWSAMEFSGVVALGENYLDTLGSPSGELTFRNGELILAHETIHQWFFGLVGNDQLNEPWLDEAFAQYMAAFYFLDTYGHGRADDYIRFLRRTAGEALRTDVRVNLSVRAYKNGGAYTRAVYGKAPLFLHELRLKKGDVKFLDFARWYLNGNRWKIVSTRQFLTQVDAFFGENLSGEFSRFFAPD